MRNIIFEVGGPGGRKAQRFIKRLQVGLCAEPDSRPPAVTKCERQLHEFASETASPKIRMHCHTPNRTLLIREPRR